MTFKRLISWLVVVGLFIGCLWWFRLPTKLMLGLTPYLLQKKCGLRAEVGQLEGGFKKGLTLQGVRLFKKNGREFLRCALITTNIKLQDIFLPRRRRTYSFNLHKPKLTINYPLVPAYLPPWTHFNINLNDAQLTVADNDETFSLTVDGFYGKLGKDGKYLKMMFKVGGDSLITQKDVLAEINGKINLKSFQGNGVLLLKNYPLSLLKPKFYDASFSEGRVDLELELIDNSLTNGELAIRDGKLSLPNKEIPPLEFNGQISLDKLGAKIKDCSLSLGDIELGLSGEIARNQEMDLQITSPGTGSKFIVRGSPREPKIFTHWGPIQTVFQFQGTKYKDNALFFPLIDGQIKLPGFDPIGMRGGIVVSSKEVRFQEVVLADAIVIQGDLARQSVTQLKLLLDHVSGQELASKFPEALRPFISTHKIDGSILVYGNIDDLNAGGNIKLFSYPLDIVCRYRHRCFSFRSIDDGAFHLSGSIKWEKTPLLKIKGVCRQMPLSDLLGLFIDKVGAEIHGVVDGEFTVTGETAQPLAKAKLEIKDGKIGKMEFDVAYLNLEWKGGVFEIQHSKVYYKDITSRLNGYIDPKSEDFFKNIKIDAFGDSFLWKGVNVKKDALEEAIVFGQQLGENVSVKFKSPMSSDPVPGAVDAEPELELEYKIKDDKNILIKMEEEEGTVGIEHKTKF